MAKKESSPAKRARRKAVRKTVTTEPTETRSARSSEGFKTAIIKNHNIDDLNRQLSAVLANASEVVTLSTTHDQNYHTVTVVYI